MSDPGAPLRMSRRLAGYSLGSVVAAITSEAAFLLAFGPAGLGPAVASAAGFVGGAVPNYVLNRRWAWSDRRGRSRRTEIILYAIVALSSYLAAVLVTRRVETWARRLTAERSEQVLLVAAAYLAVSGVFFVVKFVLYHFAVFTAEPGERAGPGEPARHLLPAVVPPTTS